MTVIWRKATRSGDAGSNDCVEATAGLGDPRIRDSKLGEDSPHLVLSGSDYAALLRSVGSV